MTEPILALRWLSTVLLPDGTLTAGLTGGFHQIVPAGTQSPFGIVRQMTSSADLTAMSGEAAIIWVPMVFQVNVYDREQHDYTRIDPLAKRIYQLLQGKQATTSDGTLYACYRVKIDAGVEPLGDVQERYINQHFAMEAVSNP